MAEDYQAKVHTGALHISSSGARYSSISASLHVEGSGSEVVAVDGTNGRLFSVTDEMSGSIFSANTIAGIPVIEATSNYDVKLDPFGNGALYFGNCPGTSDKKFNFYANVDASTMDMQNLNTGNPKILDMGFGGEAPDDTTSYFLRCTDTAANRYYIYSNGDTWSSDGGAHDSDERLKENIVDTTSKLSDINNLRVRNFNWRSVDSGSGRLIHKSGSVATQKKRVGFIAQEFEDVFPTLVEEHEMHPASGSEDAINRKGIKITALIPILVKSVQELTSEVQSLRAAITGSTDLNQLKATVSGSTFV